MQWTTSFRTHRIKHQISDNLIWTVWKVWLCIIELTMYMSISLIITMAVWWSDHTVLTTSRKLPWSDVSTSPLTWWEEGRDQVTWRRKQSHMTKITKHLNYSSLCRITNVQFILINAHSLPLLDEMWSLLWAWRTASCLACGGLVCMHSWAPKSRRGYREKIKIIRVIGG